MNVRSRARVPIERAFGVLLTIASLAALAPPVLAQGTWIPLSRNNPLPAGAPQAGHDAQGRPFHACRAEEPGGTQVGKRLPDGTCSVVDGERLREINSYQILWGTPGQWMSPRFLTTAPLVAGMENGRPLVLCRVNYEGGIHPGKMVNGVCNFPYADSRRQSPEFEVLGLPASGRSAAVPPPPAPTPGAPAPGAGRPGAPLPGRPVGGAPTTGSGPIATWPPTPGLVWTAWDASRQLPPTVPVMGRDPAAGALHVCRVGHSNAVLTGYRSADGACNIGWGNRANRFATYQLLTAANGAWRLDRSPGRVVFAGRGPNNEQLALCGVTLPGGGNLYPGFVWAGGCIHVRGGQETSERQYQVYMTPG